MLYGYGYYVCVGKSGNVRRMNMSSRNRRPVRIASMYGIISVWLILSHLAPGQSGGQENGSIAILKRMGDAFASVAEKASPGVVAIRSERKIVRSAQQTPFGQPFDPFSEDFFEFFRRRMPRQEESPGQEYTQRAQGSGFIISKEGYIVTNNHVVADADKVVVELVDGRTAEATVVGTDPDSDVAVIKIASDGLHPVALGNSDALQVGEWVLAIGNPLGLSHTVTAGIVSATGRTGFNVATYENFIQTDAAINVGNSGGPLVNLNGEAVGISTFIMGPGGGNIGIGFAIPINAAKQVVNQLIKTGSVERGYLGVIPQDLTPELAEAFDLKETKGAVISQVTEDSAAARAGLERGDIVLEFDGRAIDSATQFRNLVAAHKPGEEIEILVLRDGRRETITAKLDRRPAAEELRRPRQVPPRRPQDESQRRLGLTVQDLTPELAERFGFKDQTGVIIMRVTPGSEAAEKGLREGYVIEEVNRRPVEDAPQFQDAVSSALSEGHPILLLVTNGQISQYVVLNPSQE
jgi:serine protease Do